MAARPRRALIPVRPPKPSVPNPIQVREKLAGFSEPELKKMLKEMKLPSDGKVRERARRPRARGLAGGMHTGSSAACRVLLGLQGPA